MDLRIAATTWDPFVSALCARRDVETAGLLLARRLDGDVLLVEEAVLVPDDGYEIRRADQLRIAPTALNRVARRARESELSLFTVHTHPGTTAPWFSFADDSGDARLMPSLLSQTPGPHGSIVVAGETGVALARAWTEPGNPISAGLRVVGSSMRCLSASLAARDPEWFDRQQLALGAHGQRVLRDLHVGVVGLGGTGSATMVQLAHLGVGRLSLVDGEGVDASNVSRVPGATAGDVGVTTKVESAARYIEGLGLGTIVRRLDGHLGDAVSPTALEGCDVIFSCVDRHTPRAILNRLAYRAAVPVIDMGSAFRVDAASRVVAGAGRVVVIGPGRRCLACWGHIDPARLRLEALSPEDRAADAAEGYVQGADVPQPSVIAFNTMLAGAAVIEMLRLVTQFAGADDPPSRLAFDFITGTVKRNTLSGPSTCAICNPA